MKMNKEQEKKIIEFANYLLNLTPNEITILASFIGLFFSQFLTPNQQNVLGNFFELIGQVLITMGAQGQYITADDDEDAAIVNNRYPHKK